MSLLRVLLIGLVLSGSGCTTASWVVEEDPVPDPSSEVVLSDSLFFQPEFRPTPQNPLLSLQLINFRELSYNEHLVSKRYIQRYRPRYGYLVLGMAGMSAGLYLANISDLGGDELGSRDRALLNLGAVSLGAASYLTMKPAGDPRPAGEERMLQKSGTTIVEDRNVIEQPSDTTASLTVTRGDTVLVEEQKILFDNAHLVVDLIQVTGITTLDIDDTTPWHVEIDYNGTYYRESFSVDDLMQEFVEVTENNVPVRTAPAILVNNIIRHVDRSSRFTYLQEADDRWYRILKSSGPAYIQTEHAHVIRSAVEDSDRQELIVQSGQAVFGDLAIERNLPENRRNNPDGIAIIIANGEYQNPVDNLPYAARTGELAEHYLTNTLGFFSENIMVYENINQQQMRDLFEESDSLMIGGRQLSMDDSDLFVYYYGHAFTDNDQLHLLPVDYDPGERNERLIPFDLLSDALGKMRSRQTVLVMDTDWERSSVFGQTPQNQMGSNKEEMATVSRSLIGDSDRFAIYWAAEPGQHSAPYTGGNGHGAYPYNLFTWYFFHALQHGAETAGEIEAHLERNVPFTSRRLYDRAQSPAFWGNTNLSIVR